MIARKAISSALFLFVIFTAAALPPSASFAAEPAAAPDPEQSERNLITAAKSMRSTGKVQLNFKDLEMIQFIRFMSELLGENIVVNPGVKGTVSVVSPKVISISEARLVMLSVLEMNGLSLQGMGGYSKVMPINAGPSTNQDVFRGSEGVTPSEQLTVQIVPLRYVKSGFVVDPLKLGVQGLNIAPISGGTAVLLSGKAVLLNRAVNIIKALDVPDSVRGIKTVALKYTSAKLVEGHVNAIAKDSTSRLAGLIAIGDERSGKVILVGARDATLEAERLMIDLDVPATVTNFHVYKLQNADAKTVAEQLSQIISVAARLQPAQRGGEGGAQAMPTSVVPDLPTNSIILTATQEQYGAIKDILEELDVQPKQVLLRGLIAEVNLTKLNSAGIDWSAWGGDAATDLLIGGNVQLGATSVPAQFMQWFTEMTRTEKVNYDENGNAVTTRNIKGMGLVYAYIKMLNNFNAINVLSMPRLMCTDNMESALQVGQVIPQLRGQTSDISNPSAVQNSFEYKDTGLILKVTPHIRSGNLVALDIEQTIEEVLSTSGSTTPVTSKRLIKTNVLVANDETIILGGLIREVEKTLKNRVPGISYVPIVGNLFTSSERQREKVDLMVFLTPKIIETPQQATDATIEVTTGGDGLSIGETKTIMNYYEEFMRSNREGGVSQNTMRLTAPASDDSAETGGTK
ncbi:MAG: type II secretion system secretin GspD [Synergistaceae bacterium]|jgi:general secretion pathway protein D|nr:type II secretion system secretin GspD [Synergistaceae bacterium]